MTLKSPTARYPYIERVLPLEYAPLYEQLAELDTAIPKIVCLEKSDRLTVIEEYIDSPRLDQYLETHKLTSAQIHDLICQLLDVLAVLHQQTPPIIHRDIKPENIFYDGQKLILADFDIARNMQEDADRDTRIAQLSSELAAAREAAGYTRTPTARTVALRECIHLLADLLGGRIPADERNAA